MHKLILGNIMVNSHIHEVFIDSYLNLCKQKKTSTSISSTEKTFAASVIVLKKQKQSSLFYC